MTHEELLVQIGIMRTSARGVEAAVQEYWRTGSRSSLEEVETYAAAAYKAADNAEEYHR